MFALLALFASIQAQYTLDLPGLGKVIGVSSRYRRAIMYSGIPYATATRWGNPVPPAPWGSIDARTEAPGCPQRCHLPPHTCPTTTSESCLFLTVYQPTWVNATSSLPIVVYYHGGNYEAGSGAGELYNAEYLASHGIIYVGVNYRLSLLGFLSSSQFGMDGNYGIKDSLAALAFVQTFARALGGDPSKVTIWGQSAGAITVGSMLTAGLEQYYYETTLPQYLNLLPSRERQFYFRSIMSNAQSTGVSSHVLSARESRAARFRAFNRILNDVYQKGQMRPEVYLKIRQYDGNFRVNPQYRFADETDTITYESIINSDIEAESNRYFHAAFAISNPFALPIRTPDELEKITNFTSEYLGCRRANPADEFQCLRTQDVDRILDAQEAQHHNMSLHTRPLTAFLTLSPAMFTSLLPTTPYHLITEGASLATAPVVIPQSGDVTGFPLIIGTTADEGTLFIYEGFNKPVDAITYGIIVASLIGLDKVDPVMKVYPPISGDNREVIATIAGDLIFHCAARNITLEAESRIRAQKPNRTYTSSIWHYRYDQHASFIEGAWPDNPQCWTHVCHGADLPFWYHTGWPLYFNVTAEEEKLALRMVEHVAQFVITHQPSFKMSTAFKPRDLFKSAFKRQLSGPTTNWPAYSNSSRLALHLIASPDIEKPDDDYRKSFCDFIDYEVGYHFTDPK